jgi:hypothetical protein
MGRRLRIPLGAGLAAAGRALVTVKAYPGLGNRG